MELMPHTPVGVQTATPEDDPPSKLSAVSRFRSLLASQIPIPLKVNALPAVTMNNTLPDRSTATTVRRAAVASSGTFGLNKPPGIKYIGNDSTDSTTCRPGGFSQPRSGHTAAPTAVK